MRLSLTIPLEAAKMRDEMAFIHHTPRYDMKNRASATKNNMAIVGEINRNTGA
jgi:hypothetical protein